ncbi:MAG: peptidoglycan editing factor PgeF [Armatimonadota bacterium]
MDIRSWHKSISGDIFVHKAWNIEQTELVTHCFTTRHGGVSASSRNSLNMALHVGDDPASVLENRRRLSASLNIDPSAIVCAEQVHGSEVAVVKAEDTGSGAVTFEDSIPNTDALITNVPGTTLSLFFADCVPVFILDPARKAIGLAHAGWKGTALSIALKTVEAMQREFGTDPSGCLAAIGPSIGRCCYDVSTDAAEAVFTAAGDDRIIARACQDKMRLDLKLANWFILRKSGIPEANIAVSELCTACEAEDFFSYRRDGPTGRMAAIMALRDH